MNDVKILVQARLNSSRLKNKILKKINNRSIIEFLEVGENSDEFASDIPHTFLANSITAHCRPRQIPKKGILFFRIYSIAEILPSIPL